MFKLKNIIYMGIPALVLWGFFFFFLSVSGFNLAERFAFSFLYAGSILFSVIFIQKILIKRMRVFRSSVQILLKSLFYGVGILVGFLPIQISELIYRLSLQDLVDRIIPGLIRGLSFFLDRSAETQNLPAIAPEVVSLLISIFGVLVLVALVATGLSLIDTRLVQQQSQAKQQASRLKILEMQMSPHFLFNSLNSISATIRSDPDMAEDLLMRLTDFLRYNFKLGQREKVKLAEEIDFTENYLMLMQARFGDALKWKIDIPDRCRSVEIPGMIIQPCVENAIHHGWNRESDSELHIEIKSLRERQACCIFIKDDGQGIEKRLLHAGNFPPKEHALHNIRERLELMYQGNHLMTISSPLNLGTEIMIRIPEET